MPLSLTIFACVFGGSLLGSFLRKILPDHHLNAESKEVVRLGTGLVATMTALLLGLLVASAKTSYDTDKGEVVQMSAKIIFLDRLLANYGTGAEEARSALRRATSAAIDRIWPDEKSQHSQLDPTAASAEPLHRAVQQLAPENENQQTLKNQSLVIASEIGQMRWLLFEQAGSSISTPFLVVVVAWLTVIFISFGLFAPFNATVVATLMASALSVSCALFLILELDRPFDGLIRISSNPMLDALTHLGL